MAYSYRDKKHYCIVVVLHHTTDSGESRANQREVRLICQCIEMSHEGCKYDENSNILTVFFFQIILCALAPHYNVPLPPIIERSTEPLF